MKNSDAQGASQYQSVSVFNEAVDYFLGNLIEKTENDELEKGQHFFWVWAYQLDHAPDTYSPHMNLKNDKVIRLLINDMEAAGFIRDVELKEQPYLPDNVRGAVPTKIVGALGCRVVSLSGLKRMRQMLQAATVGEVSLTPDAYNADQAILYIAGIDVRLQPDTNQADLCRVLFHSLETMQRDWGFDEILTEWNGREGAGDDLQKIYRAARGLNAKVAAQTGAKELFIYTTKTVRINPAHLT